MELFADMCTAMALSIFAIVAIVLRSHIVQLKYNSIYLYAQVLRVGLMIMTTVFWAKVLIQFVNHFGK